MPKSRIPGDNTSDPVLLLMTKVLMTALLYCCRVVLMTGIKLGFWLLLHNYMGTLGR